MEIRGAGSMAGLGKEQQQNKKLPKSPGTCSVA
jgi:hypothetical protein